MTTSNYMWAAFDVNGVLYAQGTYRTTWPQAQRLFHEESQRHKTENFLRLAELSMSGIHEVGRLTGKDVTP